MAASWLACRLPEGPPFRVAELAGDLWYRLAPDRRGPGPAEPPPGLRGPGGATAVARARPRGGDRPTSARAARPLGVPPLRALLPRGRPDAGRDARRLDERLALETPELIAEAVVPGKAVLFVGLHFGSVELPVLFLAVRVGGAR